MLSFYQQDKKHSFKAFQFMSLSGSIHEIPSLAKTSLKQAPFSEKVIFINVKWTMTLNSCFRSLLWLKSNLRSYDFYVGCPSCQKLGPKLIFPPRSPTHDLPICSTDTDPELFRQNLSARNRGRSYDLLITSSDALILNYNSWELSPLSLVQVKKFITVLLHYLDWFSRLGVDSRNSIPRKVLVPCW